jgi:hypothetical protein
MWKAQGQARDLKTVPLGDWEQRTMAKIGKITRKAASEYLREASVLVSVFGILDYIIKPDPAKVLPPWWIPISLLFSLVLFAASVYFEAKAEG